GGAVVGRRGAEVAGTAAPLEVRGVGSARGAVVEPGTGAPPAFGGPASGTREAGEAGLLEVLGAGPAGGGAGERGAVSGKRGAGVAGTPGPRGADVAGKVEPLDVLGMFAAGTDDALDVRGAVSATRGAAGEGRGDRGSASGGRAAGTAPGLLEVLGAVPASGAEGAWGAVSGKRGEAVGADGIDGPVGALRDAAGGRAVSGGAE